MAIGCARGSEPKIASFAVVLHWRFTPAGNTRKSSGVELTDFVEYQIGTRINPSRVRRNLVTGGFEGIPRAEESYRDRFENRPPCSRWWPPFLTVVRAKTDPLCDERSE